VVAAASTAELWAKVGALKLIELLDLMPGFITHGSGYVNLQFHDWHTKSSAPLAPFSAVEGREQDVQLSDHAAALVVRRLAISNASANMTRENRSKVANADESGNVTGASG
jgi:hypothetical protein